MPLSDLEELKSALKISQCNPLAISGLIKQGKQKLFAAYDEGLLVSDLNRQYATYIDNILSYCLEHYLSQSQLQQVSLVAVGGYGRLELLPGSDVDLMILLSDEPDQSMQDSLSGFLTILWDFGLEIGHSVRTIKDCIEQGKEDITVITNMVEARLISGSEQLFCEFEKAISPENLWSSKDFYQAKIKELKSRHAKFNNTGYKLEPDIKEGPGGLRDIQIIGWVAKRHFGAKNLKELVDHHFLTQDEYEILINGQEHLWKVRFALHRLNNRREDRLLFEYQQILSEQFGFESGPNNLSIEQFMQTYYRSIMELERLSEMLLQLFREEILYKEKYDKGTTINDQFVVRNHYIQAVSADVFKKNPEALIEIFILLQSNPECEGVHATTIRLIRENLHLINDEFRSNPKINALFIKFIRKQQGVTHQLRRMNVYGVLAAYIPAFAQIVGRMQYDLYHAYTVDTHTLFVIRNLRRFSVAEYEHEFPLCSEIHSGIKKPELLYLAGLFHDIAKGRGGDHAELGSKDALHFCLQHNLPREDAKLVSTLVKLHLMMSMTAQRKDISDPEVILDFAETIGDPKILDHLYLLTVADIRGTNPNQWNNWKDSLLKELYFKTRKVLENPDLAYQNIHKIVEKNKQESCDLLTKQNMDLKLLESYCNTLPDEYFIQHTADEVAWHMKGVVDSNSDSTVLVQQSSRYKTTEIFVFTDAKNHVIHRVATVLDNLGLTVLSARLFISSDAHTFDTFIVQEQDGSPISLTQRYNEIVDGISACLNPENRPSSSRNQSIKRQLKSFETETVIEFTQDFTNHHTILEIISRDQAGLLSAITQVLVDHKVNITRANITTLGEKINDVFFISDFNNEPITDEILLNNISNDLNQLLQQNYP